MRALDHLITEVNNLLAVTIKYDRLKGKPRPELGYLDHLLKAQAHHLSEEIEEVLLNIDWLKWCEACRSTVHNSAYDDVDCLCLPCSEGAERCDRCDCVLGRDAHEAGRTECYGCYSDSQD